jgi:MGT family glycosyltransferase
MARIVFLNITARGHTNPTLALVRELIVRGETVIYYSFNEFQSAIEATGAEFRSYDQPRDFEPTSPDPNILRLATQLLETSQMLISQLLPRIQADAPDVIIHDSLCHWGLAIARILSVPAICSTTTFAISSKVAVSSFFDAMHFWTMLLTALPELRRFRRMREELRQRYGTASGNTVGVAPDGPAEMFQNDSERNIVFTSSAFQPHSTSFPKHYRFVGASIVEPNVPPSERFPIPPSLRRTYMLLGTLFNNNIAFYNACFEALATIDVHVVLSIGKKLSVEDLGTIPSNFSVYNFVPQLEVLRQSDLFITHGGMNSVHESLWFGVPMIVVPQAADQNFVANRVESTGVGVVLQNSALTSERLRSAVEGIFAASDSYKQRTAELGQSLKDAGGFMRAADEVQMFIWQNVVSEHENA